MTDTTEYSKDLILTDKVYRRGFIPELFTVPSGSYASDSNYGAGAPLVNSYGPYGSKSELPRGSSTIPVSGLSSPFVTSNTGCDIRQDGNNVEFVCSITLGGVPPAFAADDEVRIRPLPPTITNPQRWAVPLPLPRDSPVFDVELTSNTGAVTLPADTLVRARLLVNGQLALFLYVITLGSEAPVDNAFIISRFSAVNVLTLTIRGKYLTRSVQLYSRSLNPVPIPP